MHHTFSEFMGCMEWDKGELCDLIDELHADVKARDELIRDLARRIPWSAAFYDGEWHWSPSDELLAARIREMGIEGVV